MKKILLVVAVLFFSFTISQQTNAQDSRCAGWQADLDNIEKQVAPVTKKKVALKEFIDLMEDPESGLNSVQEEIKAIEAEIAVLQKKVAGGDKSPETAEELQSLRDRVELMKLRISSGFDEKIFFKQRRYLEFQKALNNAKGMETDLKIEVAELEQKLIAYKCPRKKKETDDLPDIELEGSWPGSWKWVDPTGKIIYRMALTGSGSSLSGNVKGQMINDPFTYVVNGCRETAANKVVCNFTGVYENAEAYTDVSGTVEMTLSSNNIQSRWQESQKPTVRWKGTPPKEKIPMRDPSYFNIPFKKE